MENSDSGGPSLMDVSLKHCIENELIQMILVVTETKEKVMERPMTLMDSSGGLGFIIVPCSKVQFIFDGYFSRFTD